MMNLFVISLNDIATFAFGAKYFKTVLAIIFARKGYKISFGIRLHSEVGFGRYFEGNFHIIVFEFLFRKAAFHRLRIFKLEEMFKEGLFIRKVHGFRKL